MIIKYIIHINYINSCIKILNFNSLADNYGRYSKNKAYDQFN